MGIYKSRLWQYFSKDKLFVHKVLTTILIKWFDVKLELKKILEFLLNIYLNLIITSISI